MILLQIAELDVIDTSDAEHDRHLGDVLVAEGYAEHISGNDAEVNNAPSNTITPNESFHVEDEGDEDDACK